MATTAPRAEHARDETTTAARNEPARGGPLAGLRVVELAGIGPGPHTAQILADLGADVVRVDGPPGRSLRIGDRSRPDHGLRNRRSIVADLKTADGLEAVLRLVERADVLLEGMRPGVAERLGIGPERVTEANPGLVYARVTGWGQDGPFATTAGHDLNYISVTGALHAMGRAGEPPAPPLNLVGDYGGGSMLALAGILAALYERASSGRGQVIDAAMVDGVALLNQPLFALRATGGWTDERAANVLDGGAPFYDTYRCSDDRFVAVGALEPQFFAVLLATLGIEPGAIEQYDRAGWPALRARFRTIFGSRTRDEWAATFAGTDACVTPVLSYGEAAGHPHLAARGTVAEIGGVTQAAPAPRFSRTPAPAPRPPVPTGSATAADVLRDWRNRAVATPEQRR
ncbi:CaiB/BaiF CoA transferase family protein [Nocardia harenae]|uniref:CaiB/BaiF CoA transferase family protein n=1 Tax=Nocardia harenae TaxID=358707 RepID=UPI000A06C4CD|nr:CaiB/BaiF CoA-transferase family protein [Nocardia harenae]